MFTVKTLNKVSPAGIKALNPGKYKIDDTCENPDAIIVRSATMHDIQFGDKLLCIARAGAGTNNVPCSRCAEEGIVVFNTPGANANAVKELVICALLISSRDIVGGIDWVQSIADQGDQVPAIIEKGKSSYIGPELIGKSLGVIGLGAIGAKIADAGLSLGMKVYGYDPYLSVDAAWNLPCGVIHATDIATIFENCDYITLHIPYMESTHHFINAGAISRMKENVRLINLARGELVDDDAVIAAIDNGKIARYVTDFPNAKTADVPHIIAIPHLGATTPESEDNCAVMAAQQLADYLENGNIQNAVNMPRAVLSRNGDPRLCVIHKNIPDMIAKITGVLSTAGVNIENMVNAGSKGKPHAYTMIDMDKAPGNIAEMVKSIDGVIRVRVI